MTDNLKPLKGYFKIEVLKENKVVDSYEYNNLITNKARCSIAHLLAGIAGQGIINRLVLGTQGHVDQDVLIPKTEIHGFNANRINLFCGTEASTKGNVWNEIKFTPSASLTNTKAVDVTDGSNNNSTVDIIVQGCDTNEPSITYIFNISQDAFNGLNDGVVYTEAAMFIDDKMFSMKTFKGKIKEKSVSFRITWQIIF